MVKIHGAIFLIVGISMSVISYYINSSQGINSLTLFIYVGYGFIAYGIAKLTIAYITGKSSKNVDEKRKKDKRNENSDGSIKYNKQANNDSLSNSHNKKGNIPPGYIGLCKRCGTPMREINVYCHRCGMKQ